jgi:D-xylose transport system permease protein
MATTDDTPSTEAPELVDLTAAAEVVAAEVPPEILAQNLGEYLRGWWLRVRSGDSGVLPVILGLVLVGVVFQIINGHFLTPQNLVNLFEQSTIFMVLAVAEIFVLLLGEVDLSIGATMALGAVVVTEMVQPICSSCGAGVNQNTPGPDWPWEAALVLTLLVGALIGAVQGSLVARLRLPSFVVTLAGQLILTGIAIVGLHTTQVSISNLGLPNDAALYNIFNGRFDPVVGWVGVAVLLVIAGTWMWLHDHGRRRRGLVAPPPSLTLIKIGVLVVVGAGVVAICNVNRAHFGVIEGVPYIIPLVLGVLLLTTLLLQRTPFGRHVYAVGGNPEAARRAGISLRASRTWGFVLCGIIAAFAGVLFASWQVLVTTNVIEDGNTYLLLAIAAAVIGGTSLFGGRGKTLHGILGGLIIGGIYNGLYLIGVQSAWISVVVAVVLLAAGTVDVLSRRGVQAHA